MTDWGRQRHALATGFRRRSPTMTRNTLHRLVAALILTKLAILLAFHEASAASRDLSRDRGRILATRFCAACHAVGRYGASPRTGAPPFRELGRRVDFEALRERLAEGLASGHPDMPVFRFTWRDRRAFIAYLKSIQSH